MTMDRYAWPEGARELDEDQLRSSLFRFIQHDFEIPSMPRVAVELSRLANMSQPDLAEAVRLVIRDVQLTTKVVRAAASPLYATPTKVTDVQKAAVLIGIAGMRDVAYSMYMGRVFRGGPLEGRMRQEVRRSFVSACLIHSICKALGMPQSLGFLCGMMHDIGNIAILSALSMLGRRDKRWLDEAVAEHAFGLFHEEVGARVVSQWDMSPVVVEVALIHHHPEKAGAARRLAYAVAVADAAAAIEADDEQEFREQMERDPMLQQSGLQEDILHRLFLMRQGAIRDERFMAIHR